MKRMIVQMLWTVLVFCGSPAKTRPEPKFLTPAQEVELSALTCEIRSKSKCGPGQPPEPHSFVVSCFALSPLGGGMTASA